MTRPLMTAAACETARPVPSQGDRRVAVGREGSLNGAPPRVVSQSSVSLRMRSPSSALRRTSPRASAMHSARPQTRAESPDVRQIGRPLNGGSSGPYFPPAARLSLTETLWRLAVCARSAPQKKSKLGRVAFGQIRPRIYRAVKCLPRLRAVKRGQIHPLNKNPTTRLCVRRVQLYVGQLQCTDRRTVTY